MFECVLTLISLLVKDAVCLDYKERSWRRCTGEHETKYRKYKIMKMLISEMLQVRPGDSTKRVGRGCRQISGESSGCQGVTQGGVKGSEGVDQGCQGVPQG